MSVPFPVVVASALVVLGLAGAGVVVGLRRRALGPGVFYLLGGVLVLMLAIAALVALRQR